MGTGSVDHHLHLCSSLLEDLRLVVVFIELVTIIKSVFLKLFHVLLYELHPSARVATVGIDGKDCDMVGVHLVDYILQGNHAVFEHPIPGVFFSMTTVVQVHELGTTWIGHGIFGGLFYLFQDRLLINN